MRLFEDDLRRQRREAKEADEARHRRDRDAFREARARAEAAERERREATAKELPAPRPWPGTEPEAVEARRQAAMERAAAAQVAREKALAFRSVVAEAVVATTARLEAAYAAHDLEGYVEAHSRHEALKALLGRLDKEEADRRRRAAMPILVGAVRI